MKLLILSALIFYATTPPKTGPVIQRNPFDNDRASFPICHKKSDGLDQCCGFKISSADIDCCLFNQTKPLICGTINPEAETLWPHRMTDVIDWLTNKSDAPNLMHSMSFLETYNKHFKPGDYGTIIPLDYDKDIPATKYLAYFKNTVYPSYTYKKENITLEIIDTIDTTSRALLTSNLVHISIQGLQKVSFSYPEFLGVLGHEIGHFIAQYSPDATNSWQDKENHERTADILSGLLTENPKWLARYLYLRSDYFEPNWFTDYFISSYFNLMSSKEICRRGQTITQESLLQGGTHPHSICRIITLYNLDKEYQKLTQFLSKNSRFTTK